MATETDSLQLTRAKLRRPRIAEDSVPRSLLLDRRRKRSLAFVVTPTGYVKTTLVTTWLQVCDWLSGWLSLHEEDSEGTTALCWMTANRICERAADDVLAELLRHPPRSRRDGGHRRRGGPRGQRIRQWLGANE